MLPDVAAGRTHMMMSSLASLAPHIRARTLRALAVTGTERSPTFLDLSTMVDAGIRPQ